jgi:hypothetical protein
VLYRIPQEKRDKLVNGALHRSRSTAGRAPGFATGLADGSSVRPTVRELDHRTVRGRGMQLVDAIADRRESTIITSQTKS